MKIKKERMKDLPKFGFTQYTLSNDDDAHGIQCDYFKWLSHNTILIIRNMELFKIRIDDSGYCDCYNPIYVDVRVPKTKIQDLIKADMVEGE